MAVAPFEVYEAWSRTESTWSTTDSGAKWTYHTGSGAVSSANGIGQMYIKPNTGSHVIGLSQLSKLTTREVLVRFNVSTTRAISFGIALNHDASTGAHYRVHTYGADLKIIARDANGWNTSISGYDLSAPLTAGQDYWIRFRYDAGENRLKAKIWHVGNAEPSWLISAAPRNDLLTMRTGFPAMYAINMSTEYIVRYKALYVYNLANMGSVPKYPVKDTFNRGNNYTWGLSNTKHLWEGAMSLAPEWRGYSPNGGVNAANGFGYYTNSGTANSNLSTIGPDGQKDTEIYARLLVSGESAIMRVALRGTYVSDGSKVSSYSGYFLSVNRGSGTAYLYYINANTPTLLGSAPIPSGVINDNVVHRVRLQAVGTRIRAKLWRDNTTEPSSWMIDVTHTARTSGRAMVTMHHAPSRSFRIYEFQAYAVTTIDSLTVGDAKRTGLGETSASFSATYTDDENNNGTVSIMYQKKGATSWTNGSFGAATTSNGIKTRTAMLSGLSPDTEYTAVITYSDNDGVSGTATKTLTFRTLNNSVLIPTTFKVDASSTPTQITVAYTVAGDANRDSTSRVRVRPYGTSTWGSWVTATRGGLRFETTVGSLTADTQYEIQIEISDSAGVRANGSYSSSPWTTTTTVTTIGRSVRVASVTATPTETTALVLIQYEYDTNDDATFSVQYRSAHERLYTTVNNDAITINREERAAYVTLNNLDPEMMYEVAVFPHDPDGLGPDTPERIAIAFNTLGATRVMDEKGKHFIYRIYNADGEYIGTWPDAPDPEFTWGENGGVNDLTVTLPRSFSSLNNERTINFNNRVDCWALDGSSRGMGNNLIEDENGDKGGWVLATGWSVSQDGGADNSPCLKFASSNNASRMIQSEPIYLNRVVPVVLTAVARATGGKLRMDIAAYDKNNKLIDVVDHNAETVNADWQQIKVEWLPPSRTDFLRVRIENDGKGTMHIGKVNLLVREMLIYRGEIDEFDVEIGPAGQQVSVDILGYPSYLSDDYIDFLQFVAIQPQQDINAGRQSLRQDPTDPANMLRQIIDMARKQNPRCPLYYTAESIKPTGVVAEYTFRDKILRDCIDKVVEMCPPNWHYVIDPDGCVWLRSSEEHATVHKLRLNVEISSYKSRNTIRQLKNVIKFKGRQDEDMSEPDGYGTILHTAQDPSSIKRYGRRVLKITDAQVTSPETAEIIAEGRLEENNIINISGTVVVPDEKDMKTHEGSLRGYNIQSIRPGDLVQIIDPETGPNKSFWDQFKWDEGEWDAKSHRLLSEAVPVKQVRINGTEATIELAHLPPTTRGDFARMVSVMRRNMTE